MNLSLTTWRASLFVTLGLAVACSGGPGTTETGASSSDSDSDTGNTGSTSDTGNTSVGESTTSGASDPTSGATEGGTGGTTTAGTSATTSATSGETTTATTDPTTEPTTDGTTTGAPLCEGAVDVLQWDGTPSGFVECPNGAILREEAVVCSIEPADDVKCEFAGTCTVDADCNAQPGGQCVIDEFFGECGCVYPGCESDEDCDAGMICDCGVVGQVPQCIPGDCVTNDDCGDYGCRLFDADPDCYMMQVACHGPDDLCYADSECEVGQKCFIQEGVFQCNFGGCAIGRPFLVAGAARTASVRAGAEGWRAVGLRPTRAAEAAAAQVAHWGHSARMEHASIAAFARFGLQLLALGAPPELLLETCSAIADETRHARQCFALASAYAGRPLGPGALAVERALSGETLADIVELVILEGCVGETVAAIEAAELREHVVDPVVRGVLAGVARDEGRHAALAWRFLRWALARGGDEVRARAQATFERVAVELAGAPERALSAEDRWALRQGLVTDAARQTIRAAALREVVLPTRDALRRAA